jgi:hypothetical protein
MSSNGTLQTVVPAGDYLQQMAILNGVNHTNKDIWKSNNEQTNDIITNAERFDSKNEYRGNR